MTDTPTPKRTPVTASEIADLLAWARSLSEQGINADPTEKAAFFAVKADLLARITGQPYHTGTEGGED